jgi:hypothetical protein
MKNKKKLLALAIAALLFVLAVCCAVLFFGSDEPEAATDATEATGAETAAAASDADPIFANSLFTFTASQFRERFADTLPDGFILADSVFPNPSRADKLQIDILTSAGERTGIAILFDIWEQEECFGKMALTVGADNDSDDFAILAEWYISTFLTGLTAGEQRAAHNTFTKMFNSKGDEYELVPADAHVAMMMPYEEDSGTQYYLMISIN